MDSIDTTRPVVYISLGTVFNQNIEFFHLCFEAFANIDASFVVSIGHDNQLEDFNAIPSNFTVAHVVPQTELLQHTSLFLTYAGMNSTKNRKSTRLNSSHVSISYAVFCLKKII